MRRRRYYWVALRAGLFFGVLFGVLGGGLTGAALGAFLPEAGLHRLPLPLLIPLMALLTGVPLGFLFAAVDAALTRSTPDRWLDPIGAVRQSVTLQLPLPPDEAMEALSRLVFETLEWPIENRAVGHLTLRTPRSFGSLGEQVTVDLHPTPSGSAVLLASRPLSRFAVLDYNRNRANLMRLRETLLERLGRTPDPSTTAPTERFTDTT